MAMGKEIMLVMAPAMANISTYRHLLADRVGGIACGSCWNGHCIAYA